MVKLTGLRRPMLNYLCRTGIAVPTRPGRRGRGRRRLYSFGDVVLLKALARLLRAGVSVKRMKEAFGEINRRLRDIGPTPAFVGYLVTDGDRIYLRDRTNRLEDLSENGQQCFSFVIEVGLLQKELVEDYGRLKSARR